MTRVSSNNRLQSLQKRVSAGVGRLRLGGFRLGFRLISPLAPELSARLAGRVMFRVRPITRPAWEEQHLARVRTQRRLPWRDGELALWSWGEGPTVLLVHGWEGRGTQLGHFIEPLIERGFRVVAFDGPGHGLSTATGASMPDQAAALRRVVRACGPVHGAIGHSMGAGALLYAAREGVPVGRLALFAAPMDPRVHFESAARFLRLSDAVAAQMIVLAEEQIGVQLTALNAADNARELQLPGLVIHDRDDREVPVEDARTLAAAWEGAELLLTSGLGHRRVLKDREAVARVVRFLTEEQQAELVGASAAVA